MQGKHLKEIRQHLGMTQSELAEALGLKGKNAKDTIRSWENDRREITEPCRRLIAYLLFDHAMFPTYLDVEETLRHYKTL